MLRALAESFVVSPPSGVTIKTRLRPTPAEEQALREVGTFLGSLYRADLVRRLGEGKLDAQGRAASRRERKRGLTSASASRWAGSITRATQDQYDLAASMARSAARAPAARSYWSWVARVIEPAHRDDDAEVRPRLRSRREAALPERPASPHPNASPGRRGTTTRGTCPPPAAPAPRPGSGADVS